MRSSSLKTTITLIHWNTNEAAERIETLLAAGFSAFHFLPQGSSSLRVFDTSPPTAFVLDLTRLPSHGKEIALSLRERKSTRNIPLVFVGGDPVKVEKIRALLPDAIYTQWEQIKEGIHHAIAAAPVKPVKPTPYMDRYAGRPLAKKLGLKENMTLALYNSPENFLRTDVPTGLKIHNNAKKKRDLTMWFVRSEKEYRAHFIHAAKTAIGGNIWICWTKKTGSIASDLSEKIVREVGLNAGWVDFKVCSIDDDWSGLLFKFRSNLTTKAR